MIIHGDNIQIIKSFPDNSVDSIVTDPPYGLNFMGKKWDYDVPSVELWREVLRVLKPGGHLLSFGGTRTYHRMVVAIEDAGFEIRDQVMWIYGSGFPKSMNVGKKVTEFEGFGTALKPANEPIVLARKPLSEKTVAQNVLKWGTGSLNIDGSRIGTDKVESGRGGRAKTDSIYQDGLAPQVERAFVQGRWPANVLFDEQAAQTLDLQSGTLKSGAKEPSDPNGLNQVYGKNMGGAAGSSASTGGASRFFYVAKASKRERNAGLEGANHHPTVKPIKLMEYLCKLITPPCGVILDPFCGSGSTGVAAKRLGFEFIGIEREKEYCEIAEKRLKTATEE